MVRYEYMGLKLADMPANVIEHYKLLNVATPDGYVYCEIRKGMYGLPQAGIIAQELLAKRLKEHGYSQSKTTPSLWKHEWHPIIFSLVVDDFGVKYVGEEHAEHLLKTIQKYYQCLAEKEGEQYCGLTIKWDYPNKKVHILMPKYIENALKRFQHPLLEESARANPDARIRPLTHVSVDRAFQAKSVGSNSLVTILIAIRRSPNL